jgi:hypothetical protein
VWCKTQTNTGLAPNDGDRMIGIREDERTCHAQVEVRLLLDKSIYVWLGLTTWHVG